MSLVETIREIRTIGDGYPVYQHAQVSIKEVRPEEVWPISKYVLTATLLFIDEVRNEFLRRGIDIFKLDDIVQTNEVVIAPPLVEYDGNTDCIVDGIHRIYSAKEKGKRITVLYVSGADRPIIGKPIDWNRVQKVDILPADPKARRDLREGIEDTSECLRRHYRDLSILGSKGRRPSHGQAA